MVSSDHKVEVEVKMWTILVAHRVGRVVLGKVAGMDQSQW